MPKQNETLAYDSADYLGSEEAVIAYLEEAMESGDPDFIKLAIGTVARSRGMTEVARKAGLSRESLYKALGEEGNPAFGTLLRVLQALGLRISVTAAQTH